MIGPAAAAAEEEEVDSRGGGRGGGGGLDRNGFRCGPAKEGAAATPLIGSDSAQRGAEIEACIKDVRGVVDLWLVWRVSHFTPTLWLRGHM